VQPMYAEDRRLLERSRRSLGRAADAIASTGRAMGLEKAVDDAQNWLVRAEHLAPATTNSELAKPPPPGGASPVLAVVPAHDGGLGLSRRELEVVRLVARGMTNRQIAKELVITEGTAANHVKHILARLVLDSRVQVAAWAVEHGLHRRTAS
jgi:DNA-binding NarL/FixJ family response regulator